MYHKENETGTRVELLRGQYNLRENGQGWVG